LAEAGQERALKLPAQLSRKLPLRLHADIAGTTVAVTANDR